MHADIAEYKGHWPKDDLSCSNIYDSISSGSEEAPRACGMTEKIAFDSWRVRRAVATISGAQYVSL
jgi:hypothetical protein